MVQEFSNLFNKHRATRIEQMIDSGTADHDAINSILSEKIRFEKIAVKDVKMRTFIAEGSSRNDLAKHVYDVTYGTVTPVLIPLWQSTTQ